MSSRQDKKPFIPQSLTRLENELRKDTSNPRLRGLKTFCISSFSTVASFFVGLRIMENHTRATQSAFAGTLFIGGLLAGAVAFIGLLELVSGVPYVKWVTSWERLTAWKRFLFLCAVVIGFIVLLVVGCGIYLYIEELRNPGQTPW